MEKKMERNATQYAGSSIHENLISLRAAISTTANEVAPQKSTSTQPNKRKRKTKTEKKDELLTALCKSHPAYQALRPPRKECKGCWAAYKKMNTTSYDLARRNFLRKQKQKSAE